MKLIYQKLTKSIIRRRSIQGVNTGCLHKGKYLCKNLGVKEGGGHVGREGVCSKGVYFRELAVCHMIAQVFNCLQYTETEGEG